MRILGLCGSLRRDSHNLALLREAGRLLPPGAELVIHEGLAEVPPYNADVDDRPALAVRDLRAAIAAADAVLVATPEYNSSMPGHLKNALDWVSRPFATNTLMHKPAAVIGASTGMFGAVWSQAETRKVLSSIGARVVDRELPVPNVDEQFGDDGRLLEADLVALLREILFELGEEVRAREPAEAA